MAPVKTMRRAVATRPPRGLWSGCPALRWAALGLFGLVCPLLAAQSTADERAIGRIVAARTAAWNAGDAAAWVRDFTADSGFVNILGRHFPDRAANRQRHATLFASIFRDSTLAADVVQIRFAGPDVALAEVRLRLTGHAALPPAIQETTPGVLETRLVDLLQRIDGRWRIIFSQNTAVAPRVVRRAAVVPTFGPGWRNDTSGAGKVATTEPRRDDSKCRSFAARRIEGRARWQRAANGEEEAVAQRAVPAGRRRQGARGHALTLDRIHVLRTGGSRSP